MGRNTGKIYPFPSDLVSPEKKADPKNYGIPYARAMFYNQDTLGSSLFYNDRRLHRYYKNYALGRQDTNKYKPFLGINPNNNKNSMLGAIRWHIRNYATTKINATISRISNRKFDPVVEAIDPLAIDFKKDYKARMQEYIREKDWIDSIGEMINTDLTPYGLSPEMIPNNDEELDIHLQMNQKLRSELELEDGIDLHLSRNDYEQQRKQILFDLFVLGSGCCWVGIDERGHPVVKRISPEDMVVPYSEQPNFQNINYSGDVRRMTVGEIKKLAGDQFTEKEYQKIEEEHSYTSDREHDYGNFYNNGYVTDYGDVKKVKVMYFEFLSEDELVHIEKMDRFGNKRFSRQKFDTYRTKKEQEKFKKKYGNDRKLRRTVYKTCYSGYWIVGSDLIFNYGLKKYTPRTRGHLAETNLGHKIFAPNMFAGEVVPTLKRMIPFLDDLQEYSLKLQQVISSAIPKGLKVDLFELSKAASAFKAQGKEDMDEMKLIEMFVQRGILIMNSGGEYAQGTGHKPIEELENGMAQDVIRYAELIERAKNELDDITGINRVMSGGNLHQETGKAVAEFQMQSSETAIDYLYDADEYIGRETVKTVGILHSQLAGTKASDYYSRSLGDSSMVVLNDAGIHKHDYGFEIEMRPNEQEWQRFYETANIALQQKEISLADHTFINRIGNLKRAQQYLVFAEKKQKRFLMEQQQAQMEQNQQMQMQSNEQAAQNQQDLERMKQETIVLKAEEERKTLQMKIQMETEAEMQLEQMRSGAKIQMNERLAQSKEEIEAMRLEDKQDEAIFNRIKEDDAYERDLNNQKTEK